MSATATYALLADGSTVEIRPALPGDAPAVQEMHAAMSPDNIYLRFFSVSPRAAEREAKRVCRDPDSDHAALLAWQDDRLVGVASYEPAGQPGVAEIAFAVPDDMHGRGIATLLLEHLIWQARRLEVRAFTAETLAENSAMLRVFADAGLPAKRRISGGVVDLTFPLPDGDNDLRLDSYLESVASRESVADVASLRPLLHPRSVAVVGSSRRRGTVGRAILHNIMTCGFSGSVYAVNPHARTMEGVPCVASVDNLPERVDLAVIAVPPSAVPEVAAQCGRNGVRALTVITSGLGAAGADLLAICRRYGMRLVGPNCFGVIVPWIGLDATFAAGHPPPGVAGLVVQSGGVGIALLEQLSRLGIGVSSFASVGDKYDVSSNDMLTWWAQDDVTRIAVLYVESFGSPRKFAGTARRVGQRMPVLTVVSGRSAAGQCAAASHTAAAATPLITQEALFDQAGIIATTSLGELIDTAALLACQPLPAGNRVAIVSNAGGGGVLAADACGDHGLQVVKLSAATRRKLRRLLPPQATITGPVDTSPSVSTHTFRTCLEEIAADDGVDAVLAVLVPTAVSGLRDAVAEAVVSKPLAVALLDQAESVRLLGRLPVGAPAGSSVPAAAFPARPPPAPDARRPPADPSAAASIVHPPAAPSVAHRPATAGLAAGQTARALDPASAAMADQDAEIVDTAAAAVTGVPSYADPASAARALGHAVRYQAWRQRQRGRFPELTGMRPADARTLVAGFLAASPAGGWLPEAEAAELLSCYGIPMVASMTAVTEEEAVAAAAQFGGRVVLKAEAEGLVRKADAGGVRLDLRTAAEVSEGYRALAADFGPLLQRVLVQPMLTGGVEVLIGVVQEPVFGPLVVFGLGGLATEVLGDHVARLTPLTDTDADEMIRTVRAAPLLFGHRGMPTVDSRALADALLRVSRLADDLPELTELDLNPVVAREDGIYCVDVRVRISPAEPRDPFLRRLR
ncbi:MAG: GNAT family N-acetyltransferase [Streptosporangiaceae bacterium]|jgi:acyl-CoA synthetase (NDP forming)/RimJ/RimL family protein N-acetyltransferase